MENKRKNEKAKAFKFLFYFFKLIIFTFFIIELNLFNTTIFSNLKYHNFINLLFIPFSLELGINKKIKQDLNLLFEYNILFLIVSTIILIRKYFILGILGIIGIAIFSIIYLVEQREKQELPN